MPDPLKAAAQQASIDDYRFDKPTPERAMDGLTMGEEHRYYQRACKTMGAVYSSRVKADELQMAVKLPDSLALHGMTEDEARGHERYLHDKMEEVIVWIIRWHKIKRETEGHRASPGAREDRR